MSFSLVFREPPIQYIVEIKYNTIVFTVFSINLNSTLQCILAKYLNTKIKVFCSTLLVML